MSGKILIADELATNRIVLKVKLSAAFYTTVQASTTNETVQMAAQEQPDLILISAGLQIENYTAFVQTLHAAQPGRAVPVVFLIPEESPKVRLAALQAGANDVICKPLEGPLFLAKLRNLMRQSQQDSDLREHAETAEALGLAEDPAQFTRPARIAIFDSDRTKACILKSGLAGLCGHNITAMDIETIDTLAQTPHQIDVVLVCLSGSPEEDGLRLIADLRAAPQTRHARLIATLDEPFQRHAGTILDLGANDVVPNGVNLRELSLRLLMQLHQKTTNDRMRKRLNNGLQAAAIDPLTGLYNRRYAFSCASKMIRKARQDRKTLAVMVADIDFFKSVNDTYGHGVGDIALSVTSRRLKEALQPDDLIARIGGEEFLIILNDTDAMSSRRMASRLCHLIRKNPIPVKGLSETIRLTISIGVSLFVPGHPETDVSADALIGQADKALYRSKSGGRDTVTVTTRSAA